MKTEIAEIQSLYQNDSRPLYIGYSGGKDSSVVLSLVSEAIRTLPAENRTKPIYVLFSDTLMEMPPVIGQIKNAIKKFIDYVAEHNLPFIFHCVEPEFKNRYWNQIIGKGATLPRSDMRWCTQKMKIDPMEAMVESVLNKHFGYIALTGARKDEGEDRRERLERNAVKPGSKMKVHADKRCNLFCPIEDWTMEDVWNHIYSTSENWVNANALGVMYSEAAGDGDECTTVLEGGDAGQKPGCSKSARYGCWSCSIFASQNGDKTLLNLMERYSYLSHMNNFRNWLVQYRDGRWDECRDVYNHGNGYVRLQYSYDNPRFGMTCPGGYSLEFRKEILRRLLDTEAKVNETYKIRLIEDEDLNYIQHLWLKEGDFALACVSIAKEFGRHVVVTENDLLIAKYAALLHVYKDDWKGRMTYWFGVSPNQRFCSQFIIEKFQVYHSRQSTLFQDLSVEDELKEFFIEFARSEDPSLLMATELSKLKMKTQFYPTKDLVDLIHWEWKTDKVSFTTQLLIEQNEGTKREYEDGYDWLEDENISLSEKMAHLDNWNYYAENNREEKYRHKEYDTFGGNFNSIKFRERVKGSKKSNTPEQQIEPMVVLPFRGQITIDFAA